MPTETAPPLRFAAGDTLRWSFASSDYPATAGWSVAYRLVGAGLALSIAASADGDGFVAEAAATATATLPVTAPGVDCTLFGWASKSGERWKIYEGACRVLPNPAFAVGDLRGHAARTLAAIEALVEGRATKDQMSYKIGDRELSRIPIPELLRLRDYYRSEARREADAQALASGMARPRVVQVRMGARG